MEWNSAHRTLSPFVKVIFEPCGVVLQPSLVWDPLSGRDKRNLYCVDLDFDAVEFSTPALCRGMRGPSRLRDMG
ncbi:uncharacterized protein BDCG_17722 [Blastomyces dermatitidis ER-3]|uniref:Uncharacterized protein n=1 Tax=Ajellomyces dermatitidis (strain ER-3 / ATCC MYA-2586) TaxID=559297 RepID=A0ABX2VZW1_AJEDR|nr:uncharacterized protein BDCG_17722 [Blastomyces dermatitidis ER-3]OAT02676.1 hypothetical protein BDCG_17722 [Blastomyces dermatitidis ER-3]